jgi:mono/diheme cytochrome c family protein
MKITLIGLLVLMVATACVTTPPHERELRELSGVELYEQLCSSCHGVSGRGDGPVAPLIAVGVPDLTRIAQRNGGEFPTDQVRRTIDGRWDRRAHGARDMPVWGWQLYDSRSDDDADARAQVDSMIDRLVVYLRSIQVE